MNRIIPWGERIALIQPLGIYVVHLYTSELYDISPECTVTVMIDSRISSDFCRVDSSNQVSDGDILGRFRSLLN